MPHLSAGTTAGILSSLAALGVGISGTFFSGEKIYALTESALSFFPALANASFTYPQTDLSSNPLVTAMKSALTLLHLLPNDTQLVIPGFHKTFAELVGNSTIATLQDLPSQLAFLTSLMVQLHVFELSVMTVGLFGTWTCMHHNTLRLEAEITELKQEIASMQHRPPRGHC
jgi:hypothetical protein